MTLLPAFARLLLTAQWRAHPGRLSLGVLSIAIGVAMGYAVYLINHTALSEFTQASRVLSGQADLQIQGPQSGFDEALYPRIARLPQVAAASPVVVLKVAIAGYHQPLTVLGLDVFRALQVSPDLVGRPASPQASRLDALDPGVIFLAPATMARLGLAPGDRLPLQGAHGIVSLRVAGTLTATDTALQLGVMDIAAAQLHFDQVGRLQRIDLRLRPGVDAAQFRQTLAPLLPPGTEVLSPQDNRATTADLSRAYRVNLNVLALVALFTGAFLVFSGQILSMESRRTQFALLRALGITRRELHRVLMSESLLLGLAGALLGVGLGMTIATLALHHLGTDLGGGYFSTTRSSLQFSWPATLAFMALGVTAAMLGGYLPAREAARAQPALALKASGGPPPTAVLPTPWRGVPWVLAGGALTQVGPAFGLPLAAYAAIGLVLIGAILWMPWVAHRFFAVLPRSRHPAWYLAVSQLAASPSRAAVALSGVLVSFGLMAAMVIMVSSFRVSFEHWLGVILPAQVYVRATPGDTASHLPNQDRERIASTPGVRQVEFMQTDQITLNTHLPPVALTIRPIDPQDPSARLSLVKSLKPIPPGPPPIWISEAMVDLYNMRVGQTIRIPLAGQWRAFRVAGIWRDYAHQFGAIVINSTDAQRLTGVLRPSEAALWLTPGTTAEQVIQSLHARLPAAGYTFRSTAEIRAASLHIFDRSFAVTYLLEAIAILVGLFGVGVYFGAQALTRTREFGVLRHIGATRRQIIGMLAVEGSLLGCLGVVAGLLLGWGIAWILVKIVNPQSFHWTMTLVMPWQLLAGAAVALVAAAGLTALTTGWRAMSTAAIQAVREDW